MSSYTASEIAAAVAVLEDAIDDVAIHFGYWTRLQRRTLAMAMGSAEASWAKSQGGRRAPVRAPVVKAPLAIDPGNGLICRRLAASTTSTSQLLSHHPLTVIEGRGMVGAGVGTSPQLLCRSASTEKSGSLAGVALRRQLHQPCQPLPSAAGRRSTWRHRATTTVWSATMPVPGVAIY